MGLPVSEASYAFQDRVEDREPDTGYSHAEWLVPRPAPRRADDWLEAAFAFARSPGHAGRFRRRRAS